MEQPKRSSPTKAEHRTSARRSRLGAVVLATATVFGVLFGVTAPDVSPVTPPVPVAVVQVGTTP